jgi:hypothetical protein
MRLYTAFVLQFFPPAEFSHSLASEWFSDTACANHSLALGAILKLETR